MLLSAKNVTGNHKTIEARMFDVPSITAHNMDHASKQMHKNKALNDMIISRQLPP